MGLDDILTAAQDGRLSIIDAVDPSTAEISNGHIAVGGLVALPISKVSTHIDRDEDIELQDVNGVSIGTICLVKDRANFVVSASTSWQYVAYLTEVGPDRIGRDAYKFEHDYVVINAESVKSMRQSIKQERHYGGGFITARPIPAFV